MNSEMNNKEQESGVLLSRTERPMYSMSIEHMPQKDADWLMKNLDFFSDDYVDFVYIGCHLSEDDYAGTYESLIIVESVDALLKEDGVPESLKTIVKAVADIELSPKFAIQFGLLLPHVKGLPSYQYEWSEYDEGREQVDYDE